MYKVILVILALSFLIILQLCNGIKVQTVTTDEDAHLSVPQLCEKYGYPVETHRIRTSDGYLLTAHRIPYSKKSPKSNHKRVIYLGHGLIGSSASWVTNDPDKNWAYRLADAGYDVWMPNSRGNFYSRKHVTLSPSKSEFWNFTLTEFGTYDFPAAVDYILAQTGREDLYYIGYSMGTTSVLVATSIYPEYNKKIKLSILLGATVFCTHMRAPILNLAPLQFIATNLLQGMSQGVPLGESYPNSHFLSLFRSFSCNVDILYTAICRNLFSIYFAVDSQQFSRERLPVYMGHMPAGSSVYTELHYAQLANSGRFCEYDYGNGVKPRDFDLSKVTHKVAIFYGDNDAMADMRDVHRFSKLLPNLVGYERVKYKGFTHIDFIWGTQVDHLVIEPVLKFLEKY